MDKKNKQGNVDNRSQGNKNMPDASKPGKSSDPHKTARHMEASDADDEPVEGGNDDPDKSTQIGDDPETTKKKIPNMHK